MSRIQNDFSKIREEQLRKQRQEIEDEKQKKEIEHHNKINKVDFRRKMNELDPMVRKLLNEFGEAIWGYSKYSKRCPYYEIRTFSVDTNGYEADLFGEGYDLFDNYAGWGIAKHSHLADLGDKTVHGKFKGKFLGVVLTKDKNEYYFRVIFFSIGIKSYQNLYDEETHFNYLSIPASNIPVFETIDTSEDSLLEVLVKAANYIVTELDDSAFKRISPEHEKDYYLNTCMENQGGWKNTLIFSLIGALIGFAAGIFIIKPTSDSSSWELLSILIPSAIGAAIGQQIYYKNIKFVLLKSFIGSFISVVIILLLFIVVTALFLLISGYGLSDITAYILFGTIAIIAITGGAAISALL